MPACLPHSRSPHLLALADQPQVQVLWFIQPHLRFCSSAFPDLPFSAPQPQVQALRSIQPYLQLEQLYVLGTNCTDNGPRQVCWLPLQQAA